MKAYGRNEAVGQHSVDDRRPDQQDCRLLGNSQATRGKGVTRRLQRKVARNIGKREIRKQIAA